jgi:aspartate aminotransferase
MPELKDQTIIVNGLSKAYSMTGWRLGWAAGPKPVMAAVANLQGQSTSNVVSFTQRAAAVALRSDHSFLGPWRETFMKRRKILVDGLNAIDGIACAEPMGAFYVFPDVSGLFGRTIQGCEIKDSLTFSEVLLEKANVSLVPGVAFGEDRCVRLSYATSEENIRKGLSRIADFVAGS